MNLTHLRYMVEVERLGSITKAAAALYMGQPNLSKAIKEMEREVGIPIFKRSAKGVVATEKGKEFLQYAKAIALQRRSRKLCGFSAAASQGKLYNLCVYGVS